MLASQAEPAIAKVSSLSFSACFSRQSLLPFSPFYGIRIIRVFF
jgi:hypothetical protein